MSKDISQFGLHVITARHQYDCDNCDMGCPGSFCTLKGILPTISEEKLRIINTVRLLHSKPMLGPPRQFTE